MRLCWQKEKPPELERRIKANDLTYNTQFQYANNYICTSKYNIFTFLPKNLFEQFQRIANAYFLGLLILQIIPQISSLPYYTTIVPLTFVLGITALKDAVDDYKRHRSDDQVNNRLSMVLRDGKIVEERWHKVVVGDIIMMENNAFIAADLLLLSSSEPHSLCYIETAELDGETNLKVRQAYSDTGEMQDDIDPMGKFDAEIVSEAPNNRLGKFEGCMTWKDHKYSVDNDKILLRGCVLRNTKWCYGMVIFAGKDTKLMMNSGKAVFKRTHIDKLMNTLVIAIFMYLLTVCLVCTIAAGVWETVTGHSFQQFLPWETYIPTYSNEAGATAISLLVFFSYIIILNTVVPISLYVSVEFIRLVNSLWINWDCKMYYAKTDTPAQAKTTTLNEELGQIEYIFSDKTGTLTQNIMTFNKCSINGRAYGDAVDEFGNIIDVTDQTPKVDLSENPFYEEAFEWYDRQMVEQVRTKNPDVDMFFRLLALCHTVMPEDKDGKLEYQAQSPDEGALVGAARNFGFVFKSRTPTTITIEVNGQEQIYELLCILDFNNVRKRMSVIVRRGGKIILLCKGADNVINERLDPKCADMKELTSHHLHEFASIGLRTLCLAVKEIPEAEFAKWIKEYHEASTSLENRDEKMDAIYEEIEQNMSLLGATAIEDKLQDGVPECIANLALAGIKIWVLTGDKQETAINIGYSAKLLTDEMEEVFIVDAESFEDVEKQMKESLKHIKDSRKGYRPEEEVMIANGGKAFYQGEETNVSFEDQCGDFALIINGHSLVQALKSELEQLFLELGCSCKAIICCRVTPIQKAMVVDMIKRNKQSVTLSIGDGANDVSMIKTAHIGVGISGQEGMQAVLASDYAIGQFRYLERLLLVHGRWSYLRMCKFLKYFFCKNFAFTMCHFWYAFFCGFSAQTLFDPFFISLYNVFYTSAPICALGIIDQDVDDYYSLRYPKLYAPGLSDLLFNKKMFLWSVGEGFVSSVILFFIPYGAFNSGVNPWGQDLVDIQSFGVAVASILVVSVNIRVALDTAYWTWMNHVAIWGSIIYYFCFIMAFYAGAFNYSYQGSALAVFSSATFWFSLILTNVILILPIVAYRFYETNIHPTLSDRVRLKQRMTKSKSRSREFPIRRASTMRRSTRSMRSGYAFAHQEGFGNLITSGMMQEEARGHDKADKNVTLKRITKLDSSNGASANNSRLKFGAGETEKETIVYNERF